MSKAEWNKRTLNGQYVPVHRGVWYDPKKVSAPMTYEHWCESYEGAPMKRQEWIYRTNNGRYVPMSKEEFNRRTKNGLVLQEQGRKSASNFPTTYEQYLKDTPVDPMPKQEWVFRTLDGKRYPISKAEWNLRTQNGTVIPLDLDAWINNSSEPKIAYEDWKKSV